MCAVKSWCAAAAGGGLSQPCLRFLIVCVCTPCRRLRPSPPLPRARWPHFLHLCSAIACQLQRVFTTSFSNFSAPLPGPPHPLLQHGVREGAHRGAGVERVQLEPEPADPGAGAGKNLGCTFGPTSKPASLAGTCASMVAQMTVCLASWVPQCAAAHCAARKTTAPTHRSCTLATVLPTRPPH